MKINTEDLTNLIADFFDIHTEGCFVKATIDMDVIRELAEDIVERMEKKNEQTT